MVAPVRPRIPPPFQIGFVVDDLEQALNYWTRVIGAGPFFVYRSNQWSSLFYNNAPIYLDTEMAIGQWGNTQIEFIRQLNDSPSPYRTFLQAGHRGVHHHASMVDNLDDAISIFGGAGKRPIYWGLAQGGVRFAYFVEDEHPGAMIEIIERGPLINRLMQVVADAAVGWDGADPIRYPDLAQLLS